MKQALQYVGSFLALALVVAGLTGLSYHMFRENGWVETVTGTLLGASMRSPLIALAAIAGIAAMIAIRRQTRSIRRDEGKAATMVFYVIIAAGVYFVGRLAVVGSF